MGPKQPENVQKFFMEQTIQNLSHRQKRALGLLLVGSGSASAIVLLKNSLQSAVREQMTLCASAEQLEGLHMYDGKQRRRGRPVQVDRVFAKRLFSILKICVPSPGAPEAWLIYTQTACLVGRTLLTDVASRIEGTC